MPLSPIHSPPIHPAPVQKALSISQTSIHHSCFFILSSISAIALAFKSRSWVLHCFCKTFCYNTTAHKCHWTLSYHMGRCVLSHNIITNFTKLYHHNYHSYNLTVALHCIGRGSGEWGARKSIKKMWVQTF